MLQGLTCGSTYQVSMIATNKLGSSKPSNTLTVRTQGQKPGVPQRSNFIYQNSTYVLLNLNVWPDNGCPILYFVIKYRQHNDIEWIIGKIWRYYLLFNSYQIANLLLHLIYL